LVEVGEGADLIRYFKVFHVVNLSPREHVGGLDRALTHFLVDNRLVNFLFDRVWQGRLALIRISLVGVLISANGTLISPRVIHVVVADDLRASLLQHR